MMHTNTFLSTLRQNVIKYNALNTFGPRQNDRRFPNYILKIIFLNIGHSILIQISMIFIPNGPINNKPALVLVMPFYRMGDKAINRLFHNQGAM